MRTLSAGLKREIRSFGFLYSDITADFMLPERADAPQTFDEALAAFAAMPPERARYELTRPAFFYMEESGGPESLERDDVLERIRERVSDPELCGNSSTTRPRHSHAWSTCSPPTGTVVRGGVGAPRTDPRRGGRARERT